MAFGRIGQAVGGGSGLYFRDTPDEFTGTDLAACRTARNTAFDTDGTLEDDLHFFQADQYLAIVLNPDDSTDNVIETYAPGQEGEDYDSGEWIERTDAVIAPAGVDAPGLLIPIVWEERGELHAASHGGRQWGLGHAGAGGGVYIPEDVTVIAIALELRRSTGADLDLIVPASTVELEIIGTFDTDTDRASGSITGTSVTAPAVSSSDNIRRSTATSTPTGVTISGGSWIRPITTAPATNPPGNSGQGVFTVWLQ